MEKTFADGCKITKFMKVFSLESFPLYGMLQCNTLFCRVSLKNFSRVLWQTTVHKWEIELYQDMVLRGNMAERERAAASTTDGRNQGVEDNDGGRGEKGGGERRRKGRKRQAAGWEDEGEEEEGEGLPSSKRRKAGELYSSKVHLTSSYTLATSLCRFRQ